MVVVDERAIAERYRLLSAQGVLDERGRRLWAAAEARSAGRGGMAAVVRATARGPGGGRAAACCGAAACCAPTDEPKCG